MGLTGRLAGTQGFVGASVGLAKRILGTGKRFDGPG